MSDPAWFVYLLVCRNGYIYTGVTPDLHRRITAHRAGKGAKFTRGNPPERLLGVKRCAGKVAAMRIEAQVKRQRRDGKIALAQAWASEYPVEELSIELLPPGGSGAQLRRAKRGHSTRGVDEGSTG